MGFSTNQPSDYFALGIQSGKDTEASTFIFLKHRDGTALDIDEDVVSEREGGDGQEVGFRYKRLIKFDGSANANSRGQVTALMGAMVLGKTATVTNAGAGIASSFATGLQVHRFVPNPTLPYVTAEQRYSDIIERGTNMKGASLDIEGEAGSPIRLSMSMLSGGTPYRRAIASSLTPVRDSSEPIYFPRGSYALNGAGTTKVTKFKYSAKRGIDDGIQTTELFREDLVELNADHDLDLTLKYESATLYDYIHFNGGTMIPISLATGSFTAFMANTGAGTLARAAALNLPLLHFVGAKLNRLDPDGKTVYIDVAAMTVKGATDSVILDVALASQAAFV